MPLDERDNHQNWNSHGNADQILLLFWSCWVGGLDHSTASHAKINSHATLSDEGVVCVSARSSAGMRTAPRAAPASKHGDQVTSHVVSRSLSIERNRWPRIQLDMLLPSRPITINAERLSVPLRQVPLAPEIRLVRKW